MPWEYDVLGSEFTAEADGKKLEKIDCSDTWSCRAITLRHANIIRRCADCHVIPDLRATSQCERYRALEYLTSEKRSSIQTLSRAS